MNTIIQNEDDLVSRVGVLDVKGSAREELNAGISARLEEVIMDTVLAHLSDDQFLDFKDAIAKGGESMEENIAGITAQVPGLKEIIEEEVEKEIAVLRELYSAATSKS